MIRLLHGDDEFGVSSSLTAHIEAIGPPDVRVPNTVVFEAPGVDLYEVLGAAKVAPFLADRRAVVVKGMLKPLETRGANVRKEWQSFGERIAAESMQITNDLIFVEYGKLRMANQALKTLASVAEVEVHDPPDRRDRISWLRQRSQQHGVEFSSDALTRLSEIGGDDTRRLDGEIRKLSLFVDERVVSRSDVDLMVTDASEARIFGVLDAAIDGQTSQALDGMQKLIANGESIEGIFALMARQLRLLIVAAYLLDRRTPQSEIARRLNINQGWLIDKTCRQARRVGEQRLKAMHRHLLTVDVAIKTGEMERRLAVEMLLSGW